jgi:hypothetical protein
MSELSGLYAGGQCGSVQPWLLKPNKITKAEIANIDAAKQVEPDMKLGYAQSMKDAFRLARLHKAACWPHVNSQFLFMYRVAKSR